MSTNKYVLSGACVGADSIITDIAAEYGVEPIHFSFQGHEKCRSFNPGYKGRRVILTQEELNKYDDFYKSVCSKVHRNASYKVFVRNLMIRDFYQILGRKSTMSELVIIVDGLQNQMPKGGAIYAFYTACIHKIPVILIDKDNDYKCLFLDYEKREWRHLRKSDLHKIKVAFTGIGSRESDPERVTPIIKEIFKYIL